MALIKFRSVPKTSYSRYAVCTRTKNIQPQSIRPASINHEFFSLSQHLTARYTRRFTAYINMLIKPRNLRAKESGFVEKTGTYIRAIQTTYSRNTFFRTATMFLLSHNFPATFTKRVSLYQYIYAAERFPAQNPQIYRPLLELDRVLLAYII